MGVLSSLHMNVAIVFNLSIPPLYLGNQSHSACSWLLAMFYTVNNQLVVRYQPDLMKYYYTITAEVPRLWGTVA